MRIRIAKDKADFLQALADPNSNTGVFQTYADVLVFAASVGAKYKKRIPLEAVAKEPAPISLEIFISRGYDWLIKLLAITETKDPKILSTYDVLAEEQRILIFEEYANGGLEKLKDDLRGAVDYSEILLLILTREKANLLPAEGEFDLSRFLS